MCHYADYGDIEDFNDEEVLPTAGSSEETTPDYSYIASEQENDS